MDNEQTLELRPLVSREEILTMWSPMLDSKIPEIYGMDNLCESVGMVLTGQAFALIALMSGERVGCMIYQPNGDIALIRQLYGPNIGFKFRDAIVSMMKQLGFKKIAGTSHHINGDAFQRLFNMKKIYSYYEREV